MSRITINTWIYIATDSDDVAIGHDLALSAMASIADGKPNQEAAKAFVEGMMEIVIVGPESVAAALYGAVNLFLDVAHIKTGEKQ